MVLQGNPRLVNALAKLYSSMIDRSIDPMTEVLIGIGATQILFNTFMGHLQPGDEAIIIEPFFDCYYPMIKMAGAKPVCIPLQPVRSNLSLSVALLSVIVLFLGINEWFTPSEKRR